MVVSAEAGASSVGSDDLHGEGGAGGEDGEGGLGFAGVHGEAVAALDGDDAVYEPATR